MHSFKDRTNSMANETQLKSLKMPPANGAGHASPFSITGTPYLVKRYSSTDSEKSKLRKLQELASNDKEMIDT